MSRVNKIAKMLIDEWERVEGERVNITRVATFADMARVIDDYIDDIADQAFDEGMHIGYNAGYWEGQ